MMRRRLLLWALPMALLLASALAIHMLAFPDNGAVALARRELPCVPALFSRQDAAWAGDRLAASDSTLAEAGDSVTCLASLICTQGLSAPLSDVNPGTLNAWLTENGAYDARGRLDWSKAAALLGVQLVEKQPGWDVGIALEKLLQREIYPVVQVKQPDTGEVREVLVVGSVHGRFLIADPRYDRAPNNLEIFDNRIYRYWYLK